MKINKAKQKPKYQNLICGLCHQPLRQPYDLVVYNRDADGHICELEYRHQNLRDADDNLTSGCDDRSYTFSRHVRDGIDDLLSEWRLSPHYVHPQES